MRSLLIVILVFYSCAPAKLNNRAAKKTGLPVLLTVAKVPEDLRLLFRTQVVAQGIDTVDGLEGIKKASREMAQTLSQGKDAVSRLPAMYNILDFSAIGDAGSISKISWQGYPIKWGAMDTTKRDCNTLDSLRTQPARAIAACIEEVLKSGKLQ